MSVVVWEPEAASDVDSAWTVASPGERSSIEKALSAIDRVLREDGATVGESRESRLARVLVAPPLIVRFVLQDRLAVARVVGARVFRRSR